MMPFANLPDTHKSRWSDELPAEKMKESVWLRHEAVAQSSSWNGRRQIGFVGLRDDKNPREVVNETFGVVSSQQMKARIRGSEGK